MRTLITLTLVLGTLPALAEEVRPIRFDRDVRPILADRCFQCHGPDAETREADLRLDTREGLFAKRDGTTIVAAGDLDGSELVRRIMSADPDEMMPPPDSNLRLSDEEVERLRRWIREGAEWEGHWAFSPPRRERPPVVADPSWARTPIDRFVLARLEAEGLAPSPPADRETLVRRVSLDLTGLPPTPEEVDTFLADTSPDAYERLVDRLLASPRYGEHMAVSWLDAARFADTSGYQNDGPREMWRWRDWVIDAYNANQPFDEFTIDQLAGDLRPGATLEQIVATGFNRNHRGNSEGGIVAEEFAVEYVVDRVDTTSTVWLGLTIGCARCHDHKFDPVSQREYYQLFDFFNDVPEHGRSIKEGNSPPYVAAPPPRQRRQLARLRNQSARRNERWETRRPQVLREMQKWADSWRPGDPVHWSLTNGLAARFPLDGDLANEFDAERPGRLSEATAEFVDAPTGTGLRFDGEGYVDAGNVGRFGYFDEFTVTAWVRPTEAATGGLVTRMSDDSYHDGWALHVEDGHLQVNLVKRWLDDSIRVETRDTLRAGEWQHVAFTYDGSRKASGIRVHVDGTPWPLVVHHDFLNQSMANDEPLRIGSTGTASRFTGAIADVRVYDRALRAEEVAIVGTAGTVDEIAATEARDRTPARTAKLFEYFLGHHAADEDRKLVERVREARRTLDRFEKSLPTVMVMQQLPEPRPSHVLDRGAYDRPGERVTTGVPTALSGKSEWGRRPDRLGLASWIVDSANPLTARVAVNRYWQRLFGTGLVRTAEDFGTQGERPSHPALLDWLATEFVRSGWDVKRLQRLIVTSATYRQSSFVSPAAFERDPDNRLLARGPRVRTSAEMVRDQALAASGLLVERIGGQSVKPYQPPGLWESIATTKKYVPGRGPDLRRRSVYSYVKRTVANPTMTAFDATTREACQLRRSRTNTPLQALVLMNDVTFVEAARVLAEGAMQRHDDDRARLRELFRRATSRTPRAGELAVLTANLAHHRSRFEDDESAARALVSVGESSPDGELSITELAAFTAVANLVLNLDAFVTKE